jgi:hypothetical protein
MCTSVQIFQNEMDKLISLQVATFFKRNTMTTFSNQTKTQQSQAAGEPEPIGEPSPYPLPQPVPRPIPEPITDPKPDPIVAQAKRDIDAGQVDTDMRATPGLDALLRAKLVPGPAGKNRTSGG